MSATIYINNSFCKVESDQDWIHKEIYDVLSYEIPNAHIIKRRYGNYAWDAKASMYNRRHNQFLTGLLDIVKKYLTTSEIPFQIVDKRIEPTGNPAENPFDLEGIKLYDFQKQIVTNFLKHKRGVIQSPTGSGKTVVAISIFQALGVPTLFLTHRKNLLYQTAERFERHIPGVKKIMGIIGNGEYSDNFLTIGTVQTIYKMLKDAKFLNQYKLLIVDEAHRISAKSFFKISEKCENAFYRVGLTATPFMQKHNRDNLILKGEIGGLITEITPSQLIQEGIIARPHFAFLPITEKIKKNCSSWQEVYQQGIVKNEIRNNLIAEQASKLIKMGKKPLVVIQSIEHGRILRNLIPKIHSDRIVIDFINGKNSISERKRALNGLDNGTLSTLIATNIFDEGIDIPSIDSAILGGGGLSAPAFFQRCGRTMRKKENNYSIIIDFMDYQHSMLLKHSRQRLAYVKSEPEFKLLN